MSYKIIDGLRNSSEDFRTKPETIKKRVEELKKLILDCDYECQCPNCTKSDNGISYNADCTFDEKK